MGASSSADAISDKVRLLLQADGWMLTEQPTAPSHT